tara:strand:+ start:106 stop:288 length:183 start_codon:yes stop_codon:yes gene_type:complete
MMSEEQALEMFDQMLDETSSEIEIGGCSYPYSDALKRMDPTAYRCSFADWASENRVEGYY